MYNIEILSVSEIVMEEKEPGDQSAMVSPEKNCLFVLGELLAQHTNHVILSTMTSHVPCQSHRHHILCTLQVSVCPCNGKVPFFGK